MLFIDILHYAGGYITVQADGLFLERFINICTRRNLLLWDVKRAGQQRMTAHMSLEAFREIRPVAKRTKTRLTILRRHGLPFVLHRYRRRRFALIGVAAAAALLWYTSNHVMGITVFGNSRIDTQTILANLAECGVAMGDKTQGINSDFTRNQMISRLDDLAWVGINVNGSRVYVEDVERLEKDQGIDKTQPCSLVAAKDGVIERLEVRDGQTLVKPKEGVREGDVLVSGIVDSDAAGFRFVHAYGEVFAQTSYAKTAEYPLSYQEPMDTGRETTRFTAQILNARLPLFWDKEQPYEQFNRLEDVREYRVPFDTIPSLYIKKEVYKEQVLEEKKRTQAQAVEQGTRELTEAIKGELAQGAEVKDTNVSHTLTERGTVEVTVELICTENIARQEALEEPEEDTAQKGNAQMVQKN